MIARVSVPVLLTNDLHINLMLPIIAIIGVTDTTPPPKRQRRAKKQPAAPVYDDIVVFSDAEIEQDGKGDDEPSDTSL